MACVHHLFCVFIIIVVAVVISSFAFLVNCLYLCPRVFTYSHSPPHATVGGEGGESDCLVLSCWLGLNHDTRSHLPIINIACCLLHLPNSATLQQKAA